MLKYVPYCTYPTTFLKSSRTCAMSISFFHNPKRKFWQKIEIMMIKPQQSWLSIPLGLQKIYFDEEFFVTEALKPYNVLCLSGV